MNQAHLHLIGNHVPIVGSLFALVLLGAGLLRKNQTLTQAGLAAVLAAGLLCLPAQLTGEGNATAFRDFLLKSPEMFVSLGEGCGLVGHIATYWRYQFPRGKPLQADIVTLMDIFQDFEASLVETP